MEEHKKIIVNTSVRWGGEILNKGVWFVFFMVLARRLGSADFGLFNYAFSFGSLLATFTDLGTNIFLLKEVSRDNTLAGKYLKNINAIKVVISLLVCSIAVVIPKGSSQISLAVLLFTVSLLISAFLDPLNAIYRAHKQMLYETGVMLLWRLLIVGLSIAGLYLLGVKLNGLAITFIVASLLALFVSMMVTESNYGVKSLDLRRLDTGFWKPLLAGSLPLGLLIIITAMFFKLNVIFMPYFTSPEEVGWYSAAFKVIEGTFFIPSIFLGSLFPFLCIKNENGGTSDHGFALFKRAFIFLVLLAVIGAALVTIFSGRIIEVLYGSQFAPAGKALGILSWALVFLYLNELFFYFFLSIDRQKSVLKNTAISLAGYLLLCVVLIPSFGYIGASWVLISTQALLFLLNLMLLRRVL